MKRIATLFLTGVFLASASAQTNLTELKKDLTLSSNKSDSLGFLYSPSGNLLNDDPRV